jgi:hypothetical protein
MRLALPAVAALLTASCANLGGLSGGASHDGGAESGPMCGSAGLPCCSETACNGGFLCANKLCLACGAEGEPCCTDTTCNAGLSCGGKTCLAGSGSGSGTGLGTGSGSGSGLDGAPCAAGDSTASTWGTVTLVQNVGSTGSETVSFTSRTQRGTLLVAFVPYGGAGALPSGCGWSVLSTDTPGDRVMVWPNNPGGLQSFSVATGQYHDIVLAEFSGTPAAVTQNHESDTGDQGSAVSMLDLSSGQFSGTGELVLLYLDTFAGAMTASADLGWSSLGGDHNYDFAWWSITGTTAPSARVSLSPAAAANLMMVSLKAP